MSGFTLGISKEIIEGDVMTVDIRDQLWADLTEAKVWQTESDGYFFYWPRGSERRFAQWLAVC